MLATEHDSLWARNWTRPQENPLCLWSQQLEWVGRCLSSWKGHEIRSHKMWIWGQQLVSGLRWKGPCNWSRWRSQHQPLGQDHSSQGPYAWMPATRKTGAKFNEDPSTSAVMGLQVTGPICLGTYCVWWGNLCYPQKLWWIWKISVLRLLANWLGSNWEAQGPDKDRGFVLIFNGSASMEMPKTNMCICLPVRIKLNHPVSRTQARGVKRAPDAAMDSSWAESPHWYLSYLTLQPESESV